MALRWITWPAAFTLAVLATAWISPTVTAQRRSPQNVLAIHWSSEDFPSTPVVDGAIRKALLSRANAPVDYFTEYLESDRFPAKDASLAFRDYVRRKYHGRRIDVMLAVTDPALQFLLEHRAELFPEAPIVVASNSTPSAEAQRAGAGLTGVTSRVADAQTLELALKLHPSTERVFVVARRPAEGYLDEVKAGLAGLARSVEFVYIGEQSVSRLITAIQAVPARSLILYMGFSQEDAGSVMFPDDVVRMVAQASPVPVYVSADSYVGTGVVGGVARVAQAIGTRLGEIACQVLDGARAQDIPIERIPSRPVFDWRQVRRWGIAPSHLPPGSDIRFREPTAWETYRWYIIGTIIVVAAQLLLITGLLAQRARRQRAEETIRVREATLRTSYERIRHMAGRLINAQEAARASVARDLHDDVCQRLVCVNMAVNSLKRFSGDVEAQQAFAQLERETNDMFEGIRRLSHELHPANLPLLGLASTLKAHCNEVARRHSVQVHFEAEGELRQLPDHVALCLYRIGQEALRNGVVHGKAQRFVVSLIRTADVVELTITDDGGGFDIEAVRRDAGNGLGLVSMEERARAIGAEVQIETVPQRGTTVRVRSSGGSPEHADRVRRHSWHDPAPSKAARKRLHTPIST
jgi:signal transduction histidine kinase